MAALCISLAPLAACALDAGSPASEEDTTAEASEALKGGTCGDAICGVGTYCCDPLHSRCVKKGMMCPLGGDNAAPEKATSSEPEEALAGGTCGDAICGVGTYCCDPLHSRCVKKGMMCPLGGDSAAAPRAR